MQITVLCGMVLFLELLGDKIPPNSDYPKNAGMWLIINVSYFKFPCFSSVLLSYYIARINNGNSIPKKTVKS